MYDVVPGALQRLREADIVSMAGLFVASLGQEYYRKGAVRATRRQGALLSGIVEVLDTTPEQTVSTTHTTLGTQQANLSLPGSFLVEVELRDSISCNVTCTCKQSPAQAGLVCSHAAALLYYWLAHPLNFQTLDHISSSPLPQSLQQEIGTSSNSDGDNAQKTQPSKTLAKTRPLGAVQPSLPAVSTVEILTQSGLSELRGVARAFELATNGLSKQELAEAIANVLKQPEAIRRVIATLEKPQRQLLAALTLAGGSMNDEDLRGLFERFSLGRPGQLQDVLHALQNKALIMRATFNNSLQRRIGTALSGSSLEVCWYVPAEVRAALHVTIPITPFSVETDVDQSSASFKVMHSKPYSLLTDLLLVARALDGKWLEYAGGKSEVEGRTVGIERTLNPMTVAGSIAIPPPNGTPSAALLEYLLTVVPHPLPFLRFAIRVLRLTDILYFEHDTNDSSKASKGPGNDLSHIANTSFEAQEVSGSRIMQQNRHRDEAGTSILHVLPNAARLMLGSNRVEVALELFTHWLNRASYDELFDLQDAGLHLRCRSNLLIQPALRSGELETENMDARQMLVALLAQTPSGQWINFPTFARFVYRLNPAFLQRRQRQFSSPHWWIEQEEGRTLHPTQFGDWMLAEGRFLAQLIQGPLYWWGICDVVVSNDDRLLAFQRTPLANSFLNNLSIDDQTSVDETLLPTLLSAMDVSTSGDLFIPSAFANWPLIELIERFAEVTGVHASKLCYRLTPRSLSDAFARGESPITLLALLHNLAEYQHSIESDGPLALLLEQLERRIGSYGRVRFYTDASLLEAADQQVIRELTATTSFNEQIVRPIHPTLLILKKTAIDALFDELKRRGQVPLLHDSDEAPLLVSRPEAQNGSK
jgi:hypothetical protein